MLIYFFVMLHLERYWLRLSWPQPVCSRGLRNLRARMDAKGGKQAGVKQARPLTDCTDPDNSDTHLRMI